MERTYHTHVIFLLLVAFVFLMNRTRLLSYLQDKFAAPVASMAQLFDSVALIDESRRAALAWSQCGLFLMIFVPGVYFDPVKLAMLCLAAICARVCVLRRFYRGVIRTCNVSRKRMSWRSF